jgi:glycosyltransferase involved in cell wall biosynthesis
MLDQITPVILTYNEAPNIRRTLGGLRWAHDIVLVDSFSEDDTVSIAKEFPGLRIFRRQFDTHQNQWNYALRETGITSEWVLALDADYVVTSQTIEELKKLQPSAGVDGYQARFVYCVYGKQLRGSAYPPATVLYRRRNASYQQDGHTQRVVLNGEVRDLHSRILHDDRKPLSHWLRSQDRYTQLELQHLHEADVARLSLPDRLRKTGFVFPFVIFFYCLFIKGTIFDGRAGIHYAFQRMLAEILLSLYLIEEKLADKQESQGAGKLQTEKKCEAVDLKAIRDR